MDETLKIKRSKNWRKRHYPDGVVKPSQGHRNQRRGYAQLRLNQAINRIQRGQEVSNYPWHHAAIAELKARAEDPRPKGLTLSYIYGCPGEYVIRHKKRNFAVCNHIKHYVWESQKDNIARGKSHKEKSNE